MAQRIRYGAESVVGSALFLFRNGFRFVDSREPMLGFAEGNGAVFIAIVKSDDFGGLVTRGSFSGEQFLGIKLTIAIQIVAVEFFKQADHLFFDARFRNHRTGLGVARRERQCEKWDRKKFHMLMKLAAEP